MVSTLSRRMRPAVMCGMAAAVLLGCSQDATKPEPAPQARATRMGLIALFAEALEERDIETYLECLHPDYRFVFHEYDVWDWPDWIDVVADLTVTERMFCDSTVIGIWAHFCNATVVEPPADSDEDRFLIQAVAADDTTVTAYVGLFLVNLHVVVGPEECVVDHWVDGYADFYLRPDPRDESLWTIWRIVDRTGEYLKTEPTTWSGIKAMWR